MGRDIHQADNRWIGARFRNYGSSVAMDRQECMVHPAGLAYAFVAATSSLKDVSGLLDDADVVAVLDKNVVHAFPAGTICPSPRVPARCSLPAHSMFERQSCWKFQETHKQYKPRLHVVRDHKTSLTFKSLRKISVWALSVPEMSRAT